MINSPILFTLGLWLVSVFIVAVIVGSIVSYVWFLVGLIQIGEWLNAAAMVILACGFAGVILLALSGAFGPI